LSRNLSRLVLSACMVLVSCCSSWAQQATVEGQVSVKHLGDAAQNGNGNVVVWLTPVEASADGPETPGRYRMVQKDKQFHPHVLAVPVGTAVDFPNDDPFFHNVFSLYKGKKFDLGLYEAGSTRKVVFDKPGVSFVFCNIHPDMNAYVIAVPTRYFDVSDRSGVVKLAGVPYGKYRLKVWYERAESSELTNLDRTVDVNEPVVRLGDLQLADSPRFQPKHMNKHGKGYDPEGTPY